MAQLGAAGTGTMLLALTPLFLITYRWEAGSIPSPPWCPLLTLGMGNVGRDQHCTHPSPPFPTGVCAPQSQHRCHPKAALGKNMLSGDGQTLPPGLGAHIPSFGAQPTSGVDGRATLAGGPEGTQHQPSTQR